MNPPIMRLPMIGIALAAGLAATRLPAEPSPSAQPALAAALAAAPPLEFESLAAGPDACWEGPLWWVPNPDGKTWDMVLIYSKGYQGPHEVFAYDTATKELKRFEVPGPGNNFHIVPYLLIGGKLLIKPGIGAKDVSLWVYDPATNELQFGGHPLGKGVVAGDGMFAPNADGSLIGGFGPLSGDKQARMRAGFYTIDPVTLEGEFLGAVGPENPSLFWEYGGTLMDGDWIYARYGNSPWRLFGMNVKTKQGKVIAETERIIGDRDTIKLLTNPDYPGVYVEITAFKGDPLDQKRSFWLRDGELTPCDRAEPNKAPIPPRKEDKLATPRRSFYGRMEGAANPPKGVQIRREPAADDGTVKVWWRYSNPEVAQAANVEADVWQRIDIPALKFYSVPIRHMAGLPDGSILAIGEGYARAVRLDPRTKDRALLGQAMSTYSVVPFEQKVFICGYPGSLLWVYDPAQPWTAGRAGDAPPSGDATSANNKSASATPDTNPAQLAMLKDFTDVHMPWAAAVGGDGRVYFGGKVVRIGNGGGLGWWDTRTQKPGGFHEPFDRDTIHWMCAAGEGRFIVCSTKPVASRTDPDSKPPRGRLFVYDTTTHELIHTVDDERLEHFPGFITESEPGLVMGYAPRKNEADGGLLYGFDPAAGKVTWTKPVPLPPQTAFSFMRRGRYEFDRGPDGFIWTNMGDTLVRVDPRTAEVHPVGKMEQNPILFLDGDIYVAGADQFRRITGIPKVNAVNLSSAPLHAP
jgi:hypothetical protein